MSKVRGTDAQPRASRAGKVARGHNASVKDADSGQKRTKQNRQPDVRLGQSRSFQMKPGCGGQRACARGIGEVQGLTQQHPLRLGKQTLGGRGSWAGGCGGRARNRCFNAATVRGLQLPHRCTAAHAAEVRSLFMAQRGHRQGLHQKRKDEEDGTEERHGCVC